MKLKSKAQPTQRFDRCAGQFFSGASSVNGIVLYLSGDYGSIRLIAVAHIVQQLNKLFVQSPSVLACMAVERDNYWRFVHPDVRQISLKSFSCIE